MRFQADNAVQLGVDHAVGRTKSRTERWFAGAVKRAKVQKITPHDLRSPTRRDAGIAADSVIFLANILRRVDQEF